MNDGLEVSLTWAYKRPEASKERLQLHDVHIWLIFSLLLKDLNMASKSWSWKAVICPGFGSSLGFNT
ncbi:hypothetical protein F2P79_005706 [Pimephales promelas]|nr:hypothetical protein F2P79_005706 [Pimephales promelas]